MGRILSKIRHILTGWFLVLTLHETPEAKRRREICQPCIHRKTFRCNLCGCPLIAKTRVPDETCDAKKW